MYDPAAVTPVSERSVMLPGGVARTFDVAPMNTSIPADDSGCTPVAVIDVLLAFA